MFFSAHSFPHDDVSTAFFNHVVRFFSPLLEAGLFVGTSANFLRFFREFLFADEFFFARLPSSDFSVPWVAISHVEHKITPRFSFPSKSNVLSF